MLQKTKENSKQGCLAFLFGNTTTEEVASFIEDISCFALWSQVVLLKPLLASSPKEEKTIYLFCDCPKLDFFNKYFYFCDVPIN